MLVTNYKVFITNQGDGMITFKYEGKNKKVLILKSDTIVKEIFDKYYNQRSVFRDKYHVIAKFIVRDIRKKGYIFKTDPGNSLIISPIKYPYKKKVLSNNLSADDKLYMLFHELDKKYQQMAYDSPENDFSIYKK